MCCSDLIRPHLNNLLVGFVDLLEFFLGMAQRFGRSAFGSHFVGVPLYRKRAVFFLDYLQGIGGLSA